MSSQASLNVQTIVTFVLFSMEAYIHFLIGKNSEKTGDFKFFVPSMEESFKIFGIVWVFSMLSTYFTKVYGGR